MKKKSVTKWAAGALLATFFLAVSTSSIVSAPGYRYRMEFR